MRISKQQLQEFKEMYKREFGSELSDEEAYSSSQSPLQLMGSVYKPVKKSDVVDFIRKKLEK